MLLLENYRIKYPDGKELHYADIHIRKGEVVGLFGPSGCGKTSLLESLLSPDFPGYVECRQALLDGWDIPKPGPELYRKISYCPQFSQAALNPKLTIREQITLTLKGNGLKEDSAQLQNLLCSLRLEESMLNRRPGGLSGGQQQRMVLLLCAIRNPQMMILDEPSSAIDLITLKDIVTFLETLKGRMTILMVAHSRSFLERVADRIIEL